MNRLIKKINGLFHYVTDGYSILANWPTFITELIRVKLGLKTKCTIYKLRDGTKFNIHKNSNGLNFVFYEVFIENIYEKLQEFKINKNDIIIDIGAHLGFFTIKSAKKAIDGIIYALEPFSMHFNLLKINIEQNGFKNIKYFNEAISDCNGELSFYYTLDGDPSDTSMFKINPSKKTHEEKIKAISLDDFFRREEIKICNFMKLDCEGAEYSILMSADSSTLNKIQKIAMEWHRYSDEHNPKILAEFLRGNGFNLVEPHSYEKTTGLLYAYR
jgi:FkbM family methyltransferase